MTKALVVTAAAGALAIPFGVILADDDPAEPTEPAPTSTVPEQVQDRDRRSEPDPTIVEQPGEQRAEDCECDGEGPKDCERAQNRCEEGNGPSPRSHHREHNRYEAGDADGPQPHHRVRNRYDAGDGDGPQPQNRERNQYEPDDADGPQPQNREQNRPESDPGPSAPSPEPEPEPEPSLDDETAEASDETPSAEPSAATTDDSDGANLHLRYSDGKGRGDR